MITVLAGIPGSGKSTWAAANLNAADIITLDLARKVGPQRAMQLVRAATISRLASRLNVVIDGCSTNPAHRTTWLRLAHRFHTQARLIVLHCDITEAIARQAQRPPTDVVPTHVVTSYTEPFAAMLDAIETERWAAITHIAPGR